MKKLMHFFKKTRIISRILVVLWIFFSMAGAGFDYTQFAVSFSVVAIFTLIPALIIEYFANPIISELRISAKVKKAQADIDCENRKQKKLTELIELRKEQSKKQSETSVLYKEKLESERLLTAEKAKAVKAEQLYQQELKRQETLQKESEAVALQQQQEYDQYLASKQDAITRIAKRTEYYSDEYDVDIDNIDSIDFMEGHLFEFFCADLLRDNGYSNVEVTQGSGDQGVDILAIQNGIRYAIQCKNYATPLSNTPIQEVTSGKKLYKCHVGVVMTNSTFTEKARELATATGTLLWDRHTLEALMKSIYHKLT